MTNEYSSHDQHSEKRVVHKHCLHLGINFDRMRFSVIKLREGVRYMYDFLKPLGLFMGIHIYI